MVVVTVVDSNIWIFLNLEHVPEHAAAKAAIDAHRRDGLQVNPIIVSEVSHKLSKLLGAVASTDRVRKMLTSQFVVYEPLPLPVIEEAVTIAFRHRVRINDAIVAAHALEMREGVLTDNVKDFRRVARLKVLPLRR